VSNFFGEQVLEIVIPISALSIVCLSFGKLYDSVLQKRYEFKRLAIRNMVSNIISLFLALFLAYHGYGIYSLIYSTLFQYTCYNIWTLIAGYKLQPLKFLFSYGEVKPLIKLGLFQTYTRIADYLSSKIDVIIIGKFLGVELLGIYDLSKELVQKFVMFIRTVVSQIALPFLSNSNNDDEVVKKRFLLITKIVAMICIPICFTIAVFSKEILWIVYGEKYIDAQYIVLVFAVISIATSITSFFDMLGIAKGRTDLNFKNTIYRILITTPIILLASLFSINVLAISQILITTLMVIVFWLTVVKGTYPICFSAYFRQFKNILFVTALVSILFFVAKYCMPSNITENFLINFVIYIVIYFIILLISYIVFLKEDLVFLKNVVLEKNLN
jgi:O-antigen/teichoic acid export membrane protein